MPLSTTLAGWRRRYLTARADRAFEREIEREVRDRRTVLRATRFQRHPILWWDALTTEHRWVKRGLIAMVVGGMLGIGIGLYAAVPAGSPPAAYSAAGAVALCGGAVLAVCTYAIDVLIHAGIQRLWPVAVAESAVLGIALITVIVIGVDRQVPGNHMLINLLLVGLTAMVVALAWPVSSFYRSAIREAAGQIDE